MKVYLLFAFGLIQGVYDSRLAATTSARKKKVVSVESRDEYRCRYRIEEWDVNGLMTQYWNEEFSFPKGKE